MRPITRVPTAPPQYAVSTSVHVWFAPLTLGAGPGLLGGVARRVFELSITIDFGSLC